MVYITLTDRIGNNLFQIAAGASLAYRNNTTFKACIVDYDLPDNAKLKDMVDKYKNTLFRNVEFFNGIPGDSIEYIQPEFHYTAISYFDKIRLTGYFQSEKFFDKEFVKKLFSIDPETLNYIRDKYSNLFDKEINSIHVRRGDYLRRPQRQPICGMKYYKNAINYLGSKKCYLVLSDDIEWCKTKFKGENFIFSENENPVVDLYLQSMCTNNIISNSSFSWWGAWLNNNPDKIVVTPKQWYGKQLNYLNLKDMLPDDWIRLDNPKNLSLKLKIILYDMKDLYFKIRYRVLSFFKCKKISV